MHTQTHTLTWKSLSIFADEPANPMAEQHYNTCNRTKCRIWKSCVWYQLKQRTDFVVDDGDDVDCSSENTNCAVFLFPNRSQTQFNLWKPTRKQRDWRNREKESEWGNEENKTQNWTFLAIEIFFFWTPYSENFSCFFHFWFYIVPYKLFIVSICPYITYIILFNATDFHDSVINSSIEILEIFRLVPNSAYWIDSSPLS